MNLQEAFDLGFDAVKVYVDDALSKFERRLAEIETRQLPRGEKGEPGRDGKDGIDGQSGKDGAPGRDGVDGKNGQDGRAGSQGERGAEGTAGKDGRDGIDGKSVTVDDVRPMVEDVAARIVSEAKAMVREYVDSRPLPKDGKDATPEQITDAVAKFLRANPPPPGESVKGEQGRGIGDLLIDVDGNLVVTFSDGGIKAVGRILGRDGLNGKDGAPGINGRDGSPGLNGKDGFSADELCVEWDDRGVFLKFRRGDEWKVIGRIAGVNRGTFKDGETYLRGDTLTHDNSQWQCRSDTSDKPGTSAAWQLIARKGKDGRDGTNGKDGNPPPRSTTPFGDK